MRAIHIQLSKIPLAMRAVSLYIVVGALIWGVAALTTPAPQVIAQSTPTTTQGPAPKRITSQRIVSGQPVNFSIERLAIDLPVRDGVYDADSQSWTLSTDAVYFATVTTKPNDNRGNTFIYGHNQPQVIGYMQDIQIGDVVVIKTSNNHTFRYAYTHDSVVPPDFTSVLEEDSDTPQLTVMTCEGVWSQARRLMYFDLLEVS